MRVAIFADQLLYQVPGGIGTYLTHLAPELVRQGGEDRHAFFHCGKPDQSLPGLPEDLEQVRIPGGRAALGLAWNYLGRPYIDSHMKPLDLMHATQLVVPASHVPMVATIYDLFVIKYPEYFPPRWRRLLGRGLEIVLSRARLLLAISQSTADDLTAILRPGDDRVRAIPLGVDPPPQTAPGAVEAMKEKYHLPERYLLYVGTREPRKNLERLLDAYQILSAGDAAGTGLVLAGPPGWGTDELEARALSLPGVRLVGFVPTADLDLLYKGAHALAYPSIEEGFGLPVLEAMTRGVPVVTSDTPSLREIAAGAALLVDPFDTRALAEALREACEDAGRRAELVKRGRERAGLYRWEETARLTREAYREAAA
jgi:glycosyltransferase involved in cell wall biosynthesis